MATESIEIVTSQSGQYPVNDGSFNKKGLICYLYSQIFSVFNGFV